MVSQYETPNVFSMSLVDSLSRTGRRARTPGAFCGYWRCLQVGGRHVQGKRQRFAFDLPLATRTVQPTRYFRVSEPRLRHVWLLLMIYPYDFADFGAATCGRKHRHLRAARG